MSHNNFEKDMLNMKDRKVTLRMGGVIGIPICRSIALFLLTALLISISGTLRAQTDGCGYPDNSNPPRSQVKFSTNGVLRAIAPASGSNLILGSGKSLKVWYGSNHAMLLGVR